MNFEPLGDRVVIRPDKKVYREKSEGGIDLLEGEDKEAQSGTIVALGPEAGISDLANNMSPVRRAFIENQRVVYSPYTGFAITIDGETLKILLEGEIMGILTDSEAQVEVA